MPRCCCPDDIPQVHGFLPQHMQPFSDIIQNAKQNTPERPIIHKSGINKAGILIAIKDRKL